MGSIPFPKAIVGGVLAALSVLAGYLVNNTSFGDITAGQWVSVIIAGLIAFSGVWATPDPRSESRPQGVADSTR